MLGGYIGKILFVDLDSGTVEEEALDDSLCRDFIGGYGIGARIIFSRQKGNANALGPDNILGIATGPLTGSTRCWGTRYTVMAKSPLTGAWGDANSGGEFGPFLKFSGYDAVFFRGISNRPVYLLCKDGKAELRDAAFIWGKDSYETVELLKSELGADFRIASIGPAGEKQALIASVITDNFRVAARAGLGAVMGSKKLKAVVAMGKNRVPIADKERLNEVTKKFVNYKKDNPAWVTLRKYGTCGATYTHILTGDCPIKNWSSAGAQAFPNVEAISEKRITDLLDKRHGCWHCPSPCGGLLEEGKQYKYAKGAYKPEYESIASFGPMCLNHNLESIIMASDICNRYGVDTISAGATIAFAIECYENGIIAKGDTDGIELTWGNDAAIVAMLNRMVKREGFGDILADGSRMAAQKIGRGADKYAVHVHGQEPANHSPLFSRHFATGYVVDAEPGRHTQAGLASATQGGAAEGLYLPSLHDPASTDWGKMEALIRNLQHIAHCSGVCLFGYWFMPREALPTLLSCITGWEVTLDELATIGERISTIRQAFTVREGLRPPKDFMLQGRPVGQPALKEGPMANITVDVKSLRDNYFKAMDWNPVTGIPSKEKFLKLGLEDVAAQIVDN
jgi:aldehyde:ferredoxin oxidoreductase